MPINSQIGQSKELQVDCLQDIGAAMGNINSNLWKMTNGYALPSLDGLKKIDQILADYSSDELDLLASKLKVGVQWNTEVTLATTEQVVSQIYCSALPIAYCGFELLYWARFAQLILYATYEATFYAALKNYEQNGCPLLYLTLVGGGAFGNDTDWILNAIQRSIHLFRNTPLNVSIVSFGASAKNIDHFINSLDL